MFLVLLDTLPGWKVSLTSGFIPNREIFMTVLVRVLLWMEEITPTIDLEKNLIQRSRCF